jgi:uncharacterized membrane protein YqjE
MSETTPPPGVVASARQLGSGLLGALAERLELFSLEVQEEKLRLIQLILVASAGVFAGTMALVFVSLTVVYLFWDSARIAALAGLAGFYTLGFLAVIVVFRRFVTAQSRPFAALQRELAKDRACIRPES